MAWTWQTALFFCLVALALFCVTLLAMLSAGNAGVGILRFPTTRGDRFFVSLIGSAFIFIFWLRLGGGDLVVPARSLGGLRHRDVSFRLKPIAVVARGCATGFKGRQQWTQNVSDVLKGAATVTTSAATVGGAAIISSTPAMPSRSMRQRNGSIASFSRRRWRKTSRWPRWNGSSRRRRRSRA